MRLKNLFISTIFILVCSVTNAQDTLSVNSIKIDSLQKLIDERPNADEEKVRLLNEFARACFLSNEFKRGLIATREGRLLSEELNFKGGKIMYYLTLYVFQGTGSVGNYYRKQAETLSQDPDEELAKYYVDLGIIDYDGLDDWQHLINVFSDINSYFENLQDEEISANILYDLAYFEWMLGNYEKCLEAQERAIKLFKDVGHIYPAFRISSNKMRPLNKLGREDDMRKLEAELIEFISQNEDDSVYGLIAVAMANGYASSGRYALAIEYYLKGISVFEQNGDLTSLADAYDGLGVTYRNLVMYDKAAEVYEKLIALLKQENKTHDLHDVYSQASFSNYYIKNYDRAREYMELSLLVPNEQTRKYYLARQSSMEGQILKDQQEFAAAIPYLQKALDGYVALGKKNGMPFMAMYTAECYQEMGEYPKALENALLALQMEKATNLTRTKVESELSLMLSEIYDKLGQVEKAFKHLKRYEEIRAENDELDAANRLADAEMRDILEKSQTEIELLEKQKAEKEQESKIQRLWIFSIAGALLSVLILALILFRNNKNKQKANAVLSKQKQEIQTTLEQLEATQSQLIQSEKMASLGELTAGIAHEIQNPLNFVNNFSEVSQELMEEMKEEMSSGKLDEAAEIGKDIEQNLDKIKHHGQRASDIVKSMLQHSRNSGGLKELTDVNALCDEYLRLSYHGLRAKDKSFNADLNTDFAKNLPEINVIQQDMGRVLLNLINNAFYAVKEKSETSDEEYKPMVKVSTKRIKDHLEIKIADNGNGIPEKVLEKIFQPFFTTKPAGKGTGLGLSLAYDIVKAHGGTLTVDTKLGEGSQFEIILPV